jgi:DNA repair exonuclease SbcCD ATPase subunit|tara:strand:+ start:8718 stop:11045 length:2328 start_codon:yes stop_codon:yes gene_type:complete
MKIDKLENPFIKVTWDDIPENFTQEKIKRVRSYFQRKYNSRNVTVIPKSIDRNINGGLDIDMEKNVMDTTYQTNLMSQFVKNNDMGVDLDLLKRLDHKVNLKVSEGAVNKTHYKRVYVKSIKFSNFLSFGKDNNLDVSKLGGITVIDSNPANFGGKSVLAVDLILFLFFNKTTKTTKSIEIFNRFRKDKEVFIQGEVEIDGKDYIIIRKVIRKKTKKDEWSVSTTLEFLERRPDGSLQNFTGEQRRETEKFIKESIGTMEDFLLTVLTTASNLESLIDSKPTDRGNILSRFIGLEALKDKEHAAKKMHSEWSKKLISNLYNIEDLKHEIQGGQDEKVKLEKENNECDDKLNKLELEIKTKQKNKEVLLSEKTTDIDSEIENINPRLLEGSVMEYTNLLVKNNDNLKSYGLTNVHEEVNLETLRGLIKERDTLLIKKTKDTTNLKNKNKIIKELQESEICPLCKRNLDDVDHTNEISNLNKEIKELDKRVSDNKIKINSLYDEIEIIETRKEVFDRNEKEMLKKERLVLEIDRLQLNIDTANNSLNKWKDNKTKIERNGEIEKNIRTINSSLDILNNNKEMTIRTIESSNGRKKVIDELVKSNNDKIKKIIKEEEVNKVFKTYLTIFGKNGIIKIIMKSVVPKLNNELMILLSEVTKFNVEIRVNNKNEVEFWMVDNDSGVEKILASGSGFEKTLASLAIRTVLTKVSCLPRPNITVFDEVLGKVSNENLEEVGVFFSRVKEYFENVFLITHNPLVREWSDNIITVTKNNNISEIK